MVPHIFSAEVDMGLSEEAIFLHNLCHSTHRMEAAGFSRVSVLCKLLGCMAVAEVDHDDRSNRLWVDHIVLCLMENVGDTDGDRVHPGCRKRSEQQSL